MHFLLPVLQEKHKYTNTHIFHKYSGRLWISVVHRWERLHLVPLKFFFWFSLSFLKYNLWYEMALISQLGRKILECWKKYLRGGMKRIHFSCSHYCHRVKHVISSLSTEHKLIACSKIRRLLMFLQSTFKDLFSSQLNTD